MGHPVHWLIDSLTRETLLYSYVKTHKNKNEMSVYRVTQNIKTHTCIHVSFPLTL